jgi:hypothetical protein
VELLYSSSSGNQASTLLSGTYSEIVATKEGDSFDIRYSLNIKENNATTYTMISNDKLLLLCQLQHCLLRPVILMLQ